MAGLVQAGYLASSLLCMSSISGLSSQSTARQGNMLGMLGVSSGILASLGAVGFPSDVLMQFGGVAAIGSMIGLSLPQTFCIDTDKSRSRYRSTYHSYRSSTNCRRFAFRSRTSSSIDQCRKRHGTSCWYFYAASCFWISWCLDW